MSKNFYEHIFDVTEVVQSCTFSGVDIIFWDCLEISRAGLQSHILFLLIMVYTKCDVHFSSFTPFFGKLASTAVPQSDYLV